MDQPLLVSHDGAVTVLTLNRPQACNPISEPDMVQALEDAVADVNGDRTVRAVVVTGAGSAFSSGGNVEHMRDRAGMFAGTPAQLRDGYRTGIQRIPRALHHCEVPTMPL